MTDRSSLRVADADREQLAAELREHMVAGRLTSEELEERLERAYSASTRAELDALRDDLPMSPATLDAELARAARAPAPPPGSGGGRGARRVRRVRGDLGSDAARAASGRSGC